jgi:ERCC4-type nuclease
MEVIIDNRETKIKEYYNEKILNNEILVKQEYRNFIKFSNLDLGDIVIKYNGEVKYIFERKTIRDLSDSIKDGRYHEQKQRLKYAISKDIKISYIFEYFMDYCNLTDFIKINEMNGEIILSGIVNTTLRDDFGIFLTKNTNETIFLLEAIIKRMIKNPNKYFNKTEGTIEINNSYIMKKRKKDNITKDNILMIFLNQIPGVSDTISKTLSSEFKSLNEFMSFLNNLSNDDKIEYLANKEVKLNNNKNRRIGNKISKKIIELLF